MLPLKAKHKTFKYFVLVNIMVIVLCHGRPSSLIEGSAVQLMQGGPYETLVAFCTLFEHG
jgi:hypothetical protein